MNPHSVLKRPVVTEKSTLLQEQHKYVMEVAPEATKSQVKEAVERTFDVRVARVNIIQVRGRRKRRGNTWYRTREWRKAVVSLQPPDRIELFEGT